MSGKKKTASGLLQTGISLSQRILDARQALIEFAECHTLNELIIRAIGDTGNLVGSPIGFFHFPRLHGGVISPQALSTGMHREFCHAEGKGIHSDIDPGGVWADCIRKGEPVIHNDYASLARRKGLPEGHVPVIRELVVPVIRAGEVVAALGVGNKPENYTGKDVDIVSRMADVAWQIISHKQTEEALSESEERFRRVYDHMAVGVAQVSMGFHIISANQAYCRMLGYREEELIGKHLRDLTDPSDLDENLQKQEQMARGEIDHFRMEKRFTHKDGRVVFGILDSNLVRDAEGRPIYFLGSVLDITEREEAEEALWESEVRNRAILDALPDLMFIQHRDGTFLDYHAPHGDALFTSPKRFMGNKIQDLLPKPFASKAMSFIRKALRTGGIQVYEYQLPIDGKIRYFEARIVPYGDDKVISIIREITMRKVAEERIARFGRILEDSLNEIYLFDSETLKFTQVNRAAQQNLGYSMDELHGLTPIDIKTEFSLESFQELLEPLRRGEKEKIVFETTHRRRDRSLYHVEVHLQLMKHGQESLFVAIMTDLSERKIAEKEKKRLEEQFYRGQRLESIGRLAGGVAHDLNNLLTPILGYGEMLLQDEQFGGPNRESMTEIVNAGKRARDLVRQLLAFSRRQAMEFRPVSLNALLSNFETLLRRTIRENITIDIHPGPELPLISGDPGQLEQVIMNLAVNAQDAMADGGTLTIETLRVDLELKEISDQEGVTPGPFVLLKVKDTGSGMDEETRSNVFEPFFTTKDKEKGTGLGLSTVYGIVKQHRGIIRVASGPKKGTEFGIFLPVSGQSPEPEKTVEPAPSILKGSETILLVEDNDQVRSLILAILEHQGYSVLVAEDGIHALELLERFNDPVHLLLTDVIMPGMNGIELFKEISASRRNVRVIYMSGYADDVILEQGEAEVGLPFIQKPFSVKDITTKVREVLDQA